MFICFKLSIKRWHIRLSTFLFTVVGFKCVQFVTAVTVNCMCCATMGNWICNYWYDNYFTRQHSHRYCYLNISPDEVLVLSRGAAEWRFGSAVFGRWCHRFICQWQIWVGFGRWLVLILESEQRQMKSWRKVERVYTGLIVM